MGRSHAEGGGTMTLQVLGGVFLVTFGALIGAVAFKRTTRWCALCGATFRCPDCDGRPTPIEAYLAARAENSQAGCRDPSRTHTVAANTASARR
jgi:hypothetical protein